MQRDGMKTGGRACADAGLLQPPHREAWLDVVKAFAILWIVLFHAQATMGVLGASGVALRGWRGLGGVELLASLGTQGVTLFVAASGFALTASALRRGAMARAVREYGPWLWRRIVRIVPLYWLAHAALLAYYLAVNHPKLRAGPGLWIASLFGVHAWHEPWYGGVRGPWWFIGLIVQLYLVWPLLAYALSRLSPLKFLALAWAATVLSRWLCVEHLYEWNRHLLSGVFLGCRLFEFAVGMAAAKYLWQRKSPIRWPGLLGAGGLSALVYAACVRSGWWEGPHVVTPTLCAASLCVLAWLAARGVCRIGAAAKALAWCGAMTYPIFLIHGTGSEFQIKLLHAVGIDSRPPVYVVITLSGILAGVVFQRFADVLFARVRAAVKRIAAVSGRLSQAAPAGLRADAYDSTHDLSARP